MDAAQTKKKIRWGGAAWECDTLHVVVYSVDRKTGRREPIDIQSDWISVTSEPDVLQMEAPIPGENKAWTVPLKVTREDLGPSSLIMGPSRLPQVSPTIGQYTEENMPQEAGPRGPLEVKVTVTVNILPEAASAALSLAGGVPLGALRSTTQLLKQEVTFAVEPPAFPWMVEQDEPLRLGAAAGRPDEMEIITLRCTPPQGWLFDVSARFLIESRCITLGLRSGGAQLAEGGSDEDFVAQIQLAAPQRCLKPVSSVSVDGSEGDVALRFVAITESAYIGRRVSRFEVQARAQPVAIYLGDRPAASLDPKWYYDIYPRASFDWDDENSVSVIGESYRDGAVPERARLPLALRTSEGWDVPSQRWATEGAPELKVALNDRIEGGGEGSTYIGPTSRVWKEAGEPAESVIFCETEGEQDVVEGWEQEDLWHGLTIFANVGLILRKYITHLKMRVGPTDLMTEDRIALDLANPAVEQSLIREVDVYLEIED